MRLSRRKDEFDGEGSLRDLPSYHLVIVAIASALVTFTIAILYPSDRVLDNTMKLSFGAAYAWVGAQCFLLMVPGLAMGMTIARFLPRLGAVLGGMIIFAVPIIVFCDVITFDWIGERFLSSTMHRITTTLFPAIRLHITRSSVIDAVIAICVAMFCISCTWPSAGWVARRWACSRDSVRPATTCLVLVITALGISTPALWNLQRTLKEMRDHSTRHPFCAFHLVGYRGVGFHVPTGEQAILARLRGLQAASEVQARDRRQLNVGIDRDAFAATAASRHLEDIIIVVVESFRPELVSPDVMPNLHAYAQKSIHFKQHFSEGNATSAGVFGMLNGIEAVWFDRPIWANPIMNTVLHQAGYAIGFFGGEDDWEDFGMDGFIRPLNFEQFVIEYPELLGTDYRSVQRTYDFVMDGKREAQSDPKGRMPRLGITYLLATHCRYYSEEQDEIFQPAADEDFLIPYNETTKPAIYNRYKNSAHAVDRMIKPLLRDDCIVIVIGDHGESFMEDGSAIHGLRLSKVQNMTPMIMYYPGVEPRVVEQRTMHADILPTLLSLLQIPVSDPDVFDGCDLTTVDKETLENRIFITANFMDRTSGLIGPWTSDPQQPFAYRFLCKIRDWQVDYLNPIDEQGYECDDLHPPGSPDGPTLVRDWLVTNIGKEIVREDRSESELFTQFLQSQDRETRLSALKIAGDIASPDPYLYEMITKAMEDKDPEIRDLAKKIVIRTERYIGQN